MAAWKKHLRRTKLAATTIVLFLISGTLAHAFADRSGGLEMLRPGSAMVLGLLIARARGWRDVAVISGAGACASIGLHLALLEPLPRALGFAAASTSESLVAFVLLHHIGRMHNIFDRMSDMMALVIACAAGALFSATFGTLTLGYHKEVDIFSLWRVWYVAAVLSQLVLAPMVVISAQLSENRRTAIMPARGMIERVGVLGVVALITSLVFLWTDLPLLFLIAPALLLATFRLRAFGAVGAMVIVAVITSYATAIGRGPIVRALDDPTDQMLLQQMFLAFCFLTALPVATMLTERDLRAEELRRLAERFKSVVENVGEVIFRIDEDGRWAYLNPAWEGLSGYAISASLGRSWLERIDEADRPELAERVSSVMCGGGPGVRRVAARFMTASGPRWVEFYIQCLRDQQGNVVGATGTLRDIDERKRLEDHVMSAKRRAEQRAREATLLASTDELTGIANRRAFMSQLDREISGAAEFGWPLAVAMFDVDHFKAVNDRYGHAVGDRVLQRIAERASGAVRGGDLVGRLGGEEFGILMPGASAEDAAVVAERLREAIELPRPEDEGLPAVTVSIGIATREGQRDAGALLSTADAALYAAKGAGRNRVRIAA